MPFSGSAGDGTAVALPLQAAELRLFSRGLLTGRCGRLAFLALALLLLGSLPLRSCQLGAGVCALLSGKLPQRRLPLAPLLLVLDSFLLLLRQLESRPHLLGFCLLLGLFRLGGRDRLFRRKPGLFSLVLVVVAADDDHDEDEHGEFGYGPERLDGLENLHGRLQPGGERLVVLG